MPLCFFSYKHAAFYSALAVRTFISFVPFFPSLVCQRAFTARTRCYCVAVIVILLHSSSSCQYSCTSFFNFFYFFYFSAFFCTAGAQHSSTKGDGTHHSTPPPASKLPSSKIPVLLFRGLSPCLFPEFRHDGFYRLSSSEVL